jgi:excisionase family DNA binding protein
MHDDDYDEAAPELLTIAQVAERLGLSEQTVWRHVRAHRLEAFKVGGAVRISSRAVDRFTVPYEVRAR